MPEQRVYTVSAQYEIPRPMRIPREEPTVQFQSHYDPESQFITTSFSDSVVRKGFIRKVYLIIAFQLLVTFGVSVTFSYVPAIRHWMHTGGAAFFFTGFAVFGVSMFSLAFCCDLRKRTPWNYIFLAAITLSMSWMIGTICSFYNTFAVLNAAAITLLVCLSILILTIQPWFGIEIGKGIMYMSFMVTFFTGLSAVLVYNIPSLGQLVSCVYAGIGAWAISGMVLVDTLLMTGSKGVTNGIDPDEYILAALQIYVDIVYMFLFILLCLFSMVGGGGD